MATPTEAPAPLRLPAILQNPTSASQRLVEAHNAQQREKLAARREAKARAAVGGAGAGGKGIGKRVVRRSDNAAFLDNPHIVAPRRTDLFPSVPLHPRPARPSFPPQALDRSTPIPPAAPRDRDPFSDSSLSGAFTTSLKGTRALLRKRGNRAEGLVSRLESTIRGWLGWERGRTVDDGEEEGGWKVVDDVLVDLESSDDLSTSTPPPPGPAIPPASTRRLPPQHQIHGPLPPLPTTVVEGRGVRQVPAVLELSRSVAHLTLAAADPFDRLVIHLVARYYECLSWSEEHTASPSTPVRLTHLIIPSIARPRPSAAHGLLTPETTDISDQSSQSGTTTEESGSDTETERGTEVDPDETFRVEPLEHSLSHLNLSEPIPHIRHPLERAMSASSSAYASSEADSESSVGGMGDSMMFPPLPAVGAPRPLWVEGDEDAASEVGYGARRERVGQGAVQGLRAREGWADKPTFFEYLYSA